jgi:hypothetical protein
LLLLLLFVLFCFVFPGKPKSHSSEDQKARIAWVNLIVEPFNSKVAIAMVVYPSPNYDYVSQE